MDIQHTACSGACAGWLQISKQELEAALGSLREQMGEDELRLLLERLNAFRCTPTTWQSCVRCARAAV